MSYRQSPLRPTGSGRRSGRGRRGPSVGLVLLLVVILAGAAVGAFYLYPRSSHGHAAGVTAAVVPFLAVSDRVAD